MCFDGAGTGLTHRENACDEEETQMTAEEKQELREKCETEMARLKEEIFRLRAVTQPTPPGDMDEITRMDIIINKSVNEAALVVAQSRYVSIEYALKHLDEAVFGYCVECGERIPFKRLLSMPGATLCVLCAEQMR
ncbi:dksA/traR C4-type zinc finger family protein [Deltaproteobacteria bacterium]|nr:dksA/traR C4-type zinc finger family protein [Deltaproteobacteria bacterium]